MHPRVPLSKDSTLLAPRARVTVKLSAAGQWISGENTFGSTDYWFHRQYVWRIAVQLLQSGGDNPSYLAGDCELRRSLGDSTQLFFSPYKPRHQYLWWRGSRPLNYEPTVIDDDGTTLYCIEFHCILLYCS